jgi:hypothetical protein
MASTPVWSHSHRDQMWGHLPIEAGPCRQGTIAELDAGRPLPDVLVRLLYDAAWCDLAAAYVVLGDPARVVMTPQHPLEH